MAEGKLWTDVRKDFFAEKNLEWQSSGLGPSAEKKIFNAHTTDINLLIKQILRAPNYLEVSNAINALAIDYLGFVAKRKERKEAWMVITKETAYALEQINNFLKEANKDGRDATIKSSILVSEVRAFLDNYMGELLKALDDPKKRDIAKDILKQALIKDLSSGMVQDIWTENLKKLIEFKNNPAHSPEGRIAAQEVISTIITREKISNAELMRAGISPSEIAPTSSNRQQYGWERKTPIR